MLAVTQPLIVKINSQTCIFDLENIENIDLTYNSNISDSPDFADKFGVLQDWKNISFFINSSKYLIDKLNFY